MKRLWFVQQKPFNYIPLRAGLGHIPPEQNISNYSSAQGFELCPKIYTSRKSPLKGEYVVVEGSRYKAKPVEPRIEFKVEQSFELNLNLEAVRIGGTWVHHSLLQKKDVIYDDIILKFRGIFNMLEGYSFPELDLGYKGATFEELKNVLLNLNPTETSLDTPFYVNGPLKPIDRGPAGHLQEGERVSSRSPVTITEEKI